MKSPLDSSSAPEWHDHRRLTVLGFSHGFLLLVVLGLAMGLGMRLFARHSWLCELTTAFTLPQFILAVVVLAMLLFLRAWKSAAAAMLCVVWLGFLVAPFAPWRAVNPVDVVGQPLRVMLTNVFTGNRDFRQVLTLVEEVRPDIICAQEVDSGWQAEFAKLEDTYPHHHCVPRNDNFGIGLWSRFPISDVKVLRLGDSTVPSIQCTVDVNGTPITLLNVHTLPPLLAHYADTRNNQIAEIPDLVHKEGNPFLLVGDLNITPWSPYFTDMLKESGLHSARHGHGIFPSWPCNSPLMPALCPIDHILVSPDIAVAGFDRGPRVGSDHHPVWADVLIPAAPSAR